VITGRGVTAGIDFALTVAAELHGAHIAELTQLRIEYNPQPPFDAGSPEGAGPALTAEARTGAAAMQAERLKNVQQAAARLG
jgi:cyclohexyl-isocyanide hydratase